MSELIEISGPTRICTVVGSDTLLGTHLVNHLLTSGYMVYGYAQEETFDLVKDPALVKGEENCPYPPCAVVSDWIFVCLDPCVEFETYIARMRRFCTNLEENEFLGSICYFSSGDICCAVPEAVSETSHVYPRTERDLCLATGENLLNVMNNRSGNEALFHVVRLPSIYGDTAGLANPFGFIDAQIRKIKDTGVIDGPFISDRKRSFLHISDVCEAIISMMEVENGPLLVNLPGEVITVDEIYKAILEVFPARFSKVLQEESDQFFYPDDQYLSDSLFNQFFDFQRHISFRQWMDAQRQNSTR